MLWHERIRWNLILAGAPVLRGVSCPHCLLRLCFKIILSLRHQLIYFNSISDLCLISFHIQVSHLALMNCNCFKCCLQLLTSEYFMCWKEIWNAEVRLRSPNYFQISSVPAALVLHFPWDLSKGNLWGARLWAAATVGANCKCSQFCVHKTPQPLMKSWVTTQLDLGRTSISFNESCQWLASSKWKQPLWCLGFGFVGLFQGFFGGEGSVQNILMLGKKKKGNIVASRSLVVEADWDLYPINWK